MGIACSTASSIEEKAAADGYQLLEDTQPIEENMETKKETPEGADAPQEPPVYGPGEIMKIDDAIEAIGMGK
jgi:hypothetical protein